MEARGYSEEAGFLYAASSHSDLALNAFKKSLNVEMVLSLLVGMPEEQASTVREELVERLKNASRYEQAADMIMQRGDKNQVAKKDVEQALDCYLKAAKFLRAYQLCLEHAGSDPILLNTVKTHVKIAYDIKKNQCVTVLQEFEKRMLRLKIVQHQKKHIPHQLLQMDGGNLRQFDADQLSTSGVSSYSESQFSS